MDFNIESGFTQKLGCLQGGALVSSAPTEQEDGLTEFIAATFFNNGFNGLTEFIAATFFNNGFNGYYLQGVHLSPLGFAACQSKKCTNRARRRINRIYRCYFF